VIWFRTGDILINVENIQFIRRVAADNFTIQMNGAVFNNLTFVQVEPLLKLVGY
jgi:hypothetical protein